ncbi:D-alanyl-D-alanine carboxypeptidase [Corynebacterium sp. HMSC05H05]|uniref:D-alanyl-D-alanine carboxypeptidase family protein n=1 Tax=Corynebacterium sp. HMSC05H05 TaxID=1581119 RepID=UPI0008B656A7|nr:serine hydrolase [Corynebacterium sp. HMSC05H05]OFT55591.1 D-alanyl-D-alanine carboxypeptidase [Corynebacterium sp. HMSC05H05]
MKRALAAATALSFCFATAAHAQDTETPTEATSSAGPTVGYYDEGGNWVPPSRGRAPDTDNCPQATWPPEPVSTSERAASSPSPLPVLFDGPCGITAADGYTAPDGVVASSWLVADLDSGDVVAMKDPHGRYRPASIIKVLLALTVIDELPLDQKVPVSAESAGQEGSAAGIGEGGDYTVEDLLTGLLLASGNDCAHALAQALGGDELALGKVNALAKKLGMADTRATSYSGLDGAGMSTSAWDMGLAYTAAFADPTFTRIVDTEHTTFPGFDDLPPFELWNDNQLYLNDPDGIGGKTGYTDDANHTFVGAVNHEGRRLVAIILDTTAYDHRPWEQAQMLLHEAYGVRSSVAKLEPLAEKTPETTTAAPTPEPAPEQAGEETTWNRWWSYVIVAAVLALAALTTAFSLGTGEKPRRRR